MNTFIKKTYSAYVKIFSHVFVCGIRAVYSNSVLNTYYLYTMFVPIMFNLFGFINPQRSEMDLETKASQGFCQYLSLDQT